ncbi:MAG: DUF1015 family protein [Bacteroidales bacterium]|nr:DUF1015 family protein [Bacteroidales bacterium]MCM1415914.1 DUF1015 family protein [bacterium]MCM1423523.1 DUF1015 family protein [bacterium]
MARIIPFRAVRPRADLADRIAALPYDVYNRQEAREAVKGDDYTFLRIDRPETQFPGDYNMYAPEVYEEARKMLDRMMEDGLFLQEERRAYYVYELVMDGRSQVGIGACASVDDYDNGVIKKHENTRAEKEADRIRHVDVCSAQTGPIFLAYRRREEIEREVRQAMTMPPLYDFTAKDGITHRIWVIDGEEAVERIRLAFEKVDSIYIADGHHRCASAVNVSKKRRASFPDYTGQEEFNFFLSVLFPDDQLMIMDYNRVVKPDADFDEKAFFSVIEKHFQVEKLGQEAYRPQKKGEIGMYYADNWYRLTINNTCYKNDPVEDLDVAVLQRFLLEPAFGIKDPKTDERIDFVGGIRGLAELERRVHTDAKVAFAMFPTDIHELFAVSDAGKLMPPKSTWFEPKLRSGLLLHKIEER